MKQIHGYGLEIAEYGADLWSLNSLTQTDSYLNLFKKFLYMADDCQFRMIRVDSGHPPSIPTGMTYEEAKNRVVEIFQRMADLSRPFDIDIVWEFEPGFFLNKPSEIIGLHNLVKRDNFYYMLDSCHAHMCASVGARQIGKRETLPGGEIELIKQLKDRIKIVHLIDSDNTLHDDDTSTHTPFGQGVIDFHAVLDALDAANYQGPWFVLDLCFWPDAWTLVRESKAFMDALLDPTDLLRGRFK